jgi:hypothetical protein
MEQQVNFFQQSSFFLNSYVKFQIRTAPKKAFIDNVD